MSTTVILNPYANRWQAGKQAPLIEAHLQAAGMPYTLQLTERPGHATELAQTAVASGNQPLVAAGGDGTITEVLNGVMTATAAADYPAGPVGLIPMGTANDLTDVLGIPRDLNAALDLISSGQTRTIDAARINQGFFFNNAAIGLEPMVTEMNIRLTWLKGVVRYLVAAVASIMKRPSWEAVLKWDEGSYMGSITLVSVGNTHRTGGVFYMTPNALPDDGLLDFVFAPALGRLRMFQLLPQTQKGTHVNDAEVREHQTRRLQITLETPTFIQADGELIETAALAVDFEILPGALSVFAPPAGVAPG